MATWLHFVREWNQRRNPFVEMGASSISINGRELFPIAKLADFETVLGKHSRKWEATENTLFTWDAAGIVAYEPVGSNRISNFICFMSKSNYTFSPKARFTGSLTINGVAVTRSSTLASIQETVRAVERTDDNQYSHDSCATFLLGQTGPDISFDFRPRVTSFAVGLSPGTWS